ncbi:hypothetical protein ABRP95_09780 [Corynebacterium sp. KPL2895]|uniref:hypothetical protein n=1 Tax=Corynebacterium sp. KPL2895 TaxID=3158320 RepID=UPI0032EC1AC9
MQETHTEWFKRVTRNDSNRRAADLANISPVTLGRQLKANELSADLIIKIAQAYNESPVVALVDLGFVSARWLQEVGTTTALTRASDEELTDELLRRLRLLDDQPIDDLAARRAGAPVSDVSGSLHDDDDGIVRDFDWDEPHAADSSPDEDKLREERGEDPID